MSEEIDFQEQKPAAAGGTEDAAVAAALSVHYIVMVLYALATIGGTLLFLLAAVLSKTGAGALETVIMMLAPIMFSLHWLAVRGLKRRKRWGRTASILLACLLLLGFPFGTVLGAILLSQLLKFRFAD